MPILISILEFRDKNPDRCTIVRYEDLVTAPEDVMTRVLAFIGASPADRNHPALCPGNHSELGDFLIGPEQARFDQADSARWRSSSALRYSATTRSVSSWADVSALRLSRVILPPWSRFTRSHTSSTCP